MTIAEKIRQGSDLDMAVNIAVCIVSFLVQSKIFDGTEANHKEDISEIADDILEWLESEEEAK